MTEKSFTREITVSVSPSAAYRSLTTDFDKWWAPNTVDTLEVGGTIKFHLDPTYWTMRFTKLVPDQMVELECIEANHIDEGSPDSIREEWVGTKLQWQIEPYQYGSKISLVHEGLTPSLGCYQICNTGWDYFFVNSLRNYLNSGAGSPVKIEAKI